MIQLTKKIIVILIFTFGIGLSSYGQTRSQDSIKKKDTVQLKYNFKHSQRGTLFLDNLAKKTIIFDKALNKYVIIEKIGNYYTKTPIYLTRKEYAQYQLKRDMLQYFKDKVSATNGKKRTLVMFREIYYRRCM